MSASRYERVTTTDPDHPQGIPQSPPPSFHSLSRSPSPTSRSTFSRRTGGQRIEDQSLVDAFDVHGSDGEDSDADNEGDDRQRLMRGTPSSSSASGYEGLATPGTSAGGSEADGGGAIRLGGESRAVGSTGPISVSAPVGGRVYGGGVGSDGVFANLNAKPERGEKVEEFPPTYEAAVADAVPPYWETTLLAPGSLYDPNEVYIDGLPVGSVFSFLWNGMISVSFQFVGFLLTYLLHTTHAAKNGSRAGLGITLIQYGFYLRNGGDDDADPGVDVAVGADGGAPPDPDAYHFDPSSITTDTGGSGGGGSGGFDTSEWFSYLLMIVGWFLLIRSIAEFLRARRHEQLVLQSPDRGLGTAVVAEGENPERVV